MRLLFINPNTTESMTDKLKSAAQVVAHSPVEIFAATSNDGPASIQGPEDGEAALPGLLAALRDGVEQNMDGFVIACFDDTGLDQCRELTDKPVIGIGEAAFHASMMLGHRFTVVTTLSVSVPVIEQNLDRYGLASACARVRASEVPVLELEKPGTDAAQIISKEIATAIAEDDCQAIVLGCAGMADLAARLSAAHRIPVIDGVAAAVGLCASLVSLRSSFCGQ
ncbi:MAG: aspartate/glutamate racemase family protein [Granulosicoccus sp.]|nr:aspartate/glutamate racemase family protein [Granulosicoccus sp.]